MVIIIVKEDMKGPHGQKPKIIFTCEISGVYGGLLKTNIENESKNKVSIYF